MARIRAPELERGEWIGARHDLRIADLSGKVVLLHFWTYSCVNCTRVLGELRPIEDRFQSEVVVVGIHSPKFPREHELPAVQAAVHRLAIRHPVLHDPDLSNWQRYAVKGWPTVVVVDPEGYLVGAVSGEGNGPVITSAVERAVADHDARGTLVRGAVPAVWGSTPPLALGPLTFPGKVAADPTGRRLAISDTAAGRVVVCDLQGRVEELHPLLDRPQGVCFDGPRLVVCETGADRVVAIDRVTGRQTVLATGIASPWDVAVLADGAALVAEAGRHRVWRIPPGGEASVVAGTGQEGLLDGAAPQLAQPCGIAAATGDAAVLVDADASALRRLSADGSLTTLVGQGVWDWGASDGERDEAALQHPLGVAMASSGSIVVADTFNGRLREWSGGRLTTLPVDGLDEPGGVDVLPDGRLVVADTNHHRVVIVEGSEVHPVPLDESWLGTLVGDAVTVSSGAGVTMPFRVEPEGWSLDDSAGPPVRVEVWADPPSLLAPGARAWAVEGTEGEVTVTAAGAGEGLLVVEVRADVCGDEGSTVITARTRHDLTVVAALTAASRET